MTEVLIDLTDLAFIFVFKVEFTQDKGKSKRWEADYQLVENAGLFQEYLEMGKFLSKREKWFSW